LRELTGFLKTWYQEEIRAAASFGFNIVGLPVSSCEGNIDQRHLHLMVSERRHRERTA
jgi:hypothetical protein